MARRAIDDGAVSHIFAIMDHDGPDLNECEERNVRELVEWEEEWEEVVGHALRVAVQRVEGVRSKWCWHDPFVVGFVQTLVD